MYSAADLRRGLKVDFDGVPYVISEYSFLKPGKGQSIYNCRLKNLITGATFTKSFRSNDAIDEPRLESRTLHFMYPDGDRYAFMDENYDQVYIAAAVLGDMRLLLSEDAQVEVLFHNGLPIGVTLQTFVEKEVVHTEPGARGDTATNVLKAATVKGGYELQVPLFVNLGDIIRIDTRTGEYVERVKK